MTSRDAGTRGWWHGGKPRSGAGRGRVVWDAGTVGRGGHCHCQRQRQWLFGSDPPVPAGWRLPSIPFDFIESVDKLVDVEIYY